MEGSLSECVLDEPNHNTSRCCSNHSKQRSTVSTSCHSDKNSVPHPHGLNHDGHYGDDFTSSNSSSMVATSSSSSSSSNIRNSSKITCTSHADINNNSNSNSNNNNNSNTRAACHPCVKLLHKVLSQPCSRPRALLESMMRQQQQQQQSQQQQQQQRAGNWTNDKFNKNTNNCMSHADVSHETIASSSVLNVTQTDSPSAVRASASFTSKCNGNSSFSILSWRPIPDGALVEIPSQKPDTILRRWTRLMLPPSPPPPPPPPPPALLPLQPQPLNAIDEVTLDLPQQQNQQKQQHEQEQLPFATDLWQLATSAAFTQPPPPPLPITSITNFSIHLDPSILSLSVAPDTATMESTRNTTSVINAQQQQQPAAAAATTTTGTTSIASTEWMTLQCRPCADIGPEGNARAFVMGPTPLSMVVCTNRLRLISDHDVPAVSEVEEIMTHELMHVYDVRMQQLDLRDCESLAYSEVRAAREAECRNLVVADVRGLGNKQQHEHESQSLQQQQQAAAAASCIRHKAVTATRNLFPLRGRQCVDRVLAQAMADHQPFDVQSSSSS